MSALQSPAGGVSSTPAPPVGQHRADVPVRTVPHVPWFVPKHRKSHALFDLAIDWQASSPEVPC